MITHNFSFYGAGGRVCRLDASRLYSTPLTTPVYKDYSIDVDLSEYGQLAAVTLDGRLWLFQEDSSLDFVVLMWNSDKGQMTFAETRHFDGADEVVLARGLDWILTNRNIFMVNDSAPYIRKATLFDENTPSTFLYSALRNSNVPISGADPFTKQAWGKRDDNGNSGGNARFSRDTHLLYPAGTHTFEQCYSLLPAVGDWIIFENFLIRRPDNTLTEHFDYMLNVRPLIPLELLDEGAAAFGTGYNFDHRGIQLAYLNGQLWGRGLYHIGRVLILPAGFDQQGQPQAFYLYICNDYYPPDHPSGFYLSHAVDFKYFEEHTFALFNDCSDWDYSEIRCRLMGGHLATSTTPQKNSFLSSFELSGFVALGGTRTFQGQWSWTNGESWDFTSWRTSQSRLLSGDRLCLLPDGLWDKCYGTKSNLEGYICEWDCILSPVQQDFLFQQWLHVALASLGQDYLCGFLASEPMPITGGACVASVDAAILDTSGETPVWLSLSENHGKLFFDYPNLDALLLDDDGAQIFNNGLTPALDYKGHTLRQWLAPADKVEAVSEAGVAASADSAAFFSNFQRGFHREVFSPCALPLTATAYRDNNGNSCMISANNHSEGVDIKHSLSNGSIPASILWEDIYREPVKVRLSHSFEEGSYSPYLAREPVIPSAIGDVHATLNACARKSDLFEQYSLLDAAFSDFGISYSGDIPIDDLEAHKARLFQWPYLLGNSRTFLPLCVTKTTAYYSSFYVCEVYYEEEDIVRIQFFSDLPQDFDNYDKYRIYWETSFLQSIDIEFSYFDFSSGSVKSLTCVCPCDFFITQDYREINPYWWDAPYSSALVSVYAPLQQSSGILLLVDEQDIYLPMISYSEEFREADQDHASYAGYASLSFKRIASLPAGLRKHANNGDCFSAIEYKPPEIVVDGNGWFQGVYAQTHEVTYPSGQTYNEEISYFPDIEKRKQLFFPSVEILNVNTANNIAVGYSFVSTLVFRVIDTGMLFYIQLDAKEYLYRAQYYTYLDHNNFYVDAQGFKRSKTNFHFVYTQDSKKLLIFRSEYDPDALTFNVTEVDSAQ